MEMSFLIEGHLGCDTKCKYYHSENDLLFKENTNNITLKLNNKRADKKTEFSEVG